MDYKKYIIVILIYPSYIYSQCTTRPLITPPYNGPQGGTSTISTAWFAECTPSQSGDKIQWQKQIPGQWITLFECPYGNLDGQANDRGEDYDIHGRSVGSGQATGHTLTITDSQPCDSGTWRVRIAHNGVNIDSEPSSGLSINAYPKRSDIIITPPNSTILFAGEDVTFNCKAENLRPKPTVQWKFNGTDDPSGVDGDSEIPCEGNVWSLNNIKTKKFETSGTLSVLCILDQNGNQTNSNTVNFDTLAPPKIIKEISIDKPNPVANESYSLTCIASGSDVKVSWMKDDKPIDEKYFDAPVESDDPRGDLDFGQTIARKSTLTTKKFNSPTAETINNQSGNFSCQATVLTQSDIKKTSTQLSYIPVPNGEFIVPFSVTGTSTVAMECNVTAFPLPNYTWHRADETLRYTTRTVDVKVMENTNFSCNAKNLAGSTDLYFLVTVNPSDEGLSVGAIVGICIAVIACFAVILTLLAFLYKKKQREKADEEVTAYAESGNTGGGNTGVNTINGGTTAATAPVYAEVDKHKKKKSPTNTAAPVYSEVNKDKKKKQNKEEPAGSVYNQVNKPDRPLPHLKPKSGSTNTGPVYSEVNKPNKGRLTPIENQHYDNSGQRNEHGGLHYADVDFLRQGNGGTKHSHSTKNPSYEPTEYAQIDHRKSAGIVV